MSLDSAMKSTNEMDGLDLGELDLDLDGVDMTGGTSGGVALGVASSPSQSPTTHSLPLPNIHPAPLNIPSIPTPLSIPTGTGPQTQHQQPLSPDRHTRAVEWTALLERRRRAGARALAEAGLGLAEAGPYGVYSAYGAASPSASTVGVGGQDPDGLPDEVAEDYASSAGSEYDSSASASASASEGYASSGEYDARNGAPEGYDARGYDNRTAYGARGGAMGRRRSRLGEVVVCSWEVGVDVPDADEQQQRNGGEQQEQSPLSDANAHPGNDTANPNTPTLINITHNSNSVGGGDLGPNPHERLSQAWGVWKIACRVRVWDVRTRYTPALIRSLVAQEADDYFSAHGLQHPDALLFMEEEYYDWELEESGSDGSGDGSPEEEWSGDVSPEEWSGDVSPEGEGERDADGEAEVDEEYKGYVDDDHAQQHDAQPHAQPHAQMDDDPRAMGGVLSAFYVGGQQQQLPPLPLPPPRLASVRVPVLRHLFQDTPGERERESSLSFALGV
ncbi:hypothetical protein C8J57DRAFT_163122 [Mycena rebaudengoi]|nr:hypothetical protein C8J57DRAFT_163122 [Mycena rebaudengoi]